MTAEDFFTGLFETELKLGELIVAVKFPAIQSGTAVGFAELSRRQGDFALVGLAALATMRRDRIGTARLAYFGCVDHAKVARAVSAAVTGLATPLPDTSAFEQAIRQDLTPEDTTGLRADTKLHMATVLTRRVLNSLSEKVTP